ncbi:MAG TPA: alpha/beta hydrolase-fold protein [Pedococcus sp.]
MPLLGWPLVTMLSVLVVASVAGTLLLWGRVRGPRPARAAQRVGLVLLCQLTAVLVLGAAVNDWGYFYGSWSDLFGTSSATPSVQAAGHPLAQGHFGRTGATTVGVVGASQSTWSGPAEWATRGRVEQVRVHGLRSAITATAEVYLPPQYFQPAWAHRQLPVVEVLGGYPGDTLGLVSRMHYPDKLLAEIHAGRARPMVLVMLRPTVAPPRDTECTDVPGGPLAMTFLAQDLPSAMDHLLRVRPVGWGVMGDSTGGYCAVKLAMTHSVQYSAAVAMSGYYHTLQDSTTGDLWGGSRVLRDLNDPEWLLAHQPPPPVSVLVSMGTAERGALGLADTRRFLQLVKAPMTASSMLLPGGGHNFANWGKVMPAAFDFLSARLGA